jgi:hypothetical protein
MVVFVAARGGRARRALLLWIESLGSALNGGEFGMKVGVTLMGFWREGLFATLLEATRGRRVSR